MAAAAAAAAPSWHHRLLTLLSASPALRHLRSIHALFLTTNLLPNPYALSRLIAALSSLPHALPHASLLCRHAPSPPTTFAHNTLIRAHARSPHPLLALPFFLSLLRTNSADHHSFPFALAACTAAPAISSQIHSMLVKNGLSSADHFVQTALLRLYAEKPDGRNMFDDIPHRDVVHYDVLMNGYLHRGLSAEAVSLFDEMVSAGVDPDAHAVTTALKACALSGALRQGKWIHSYLETKCLFSMDAYIGSALVSMYAKCGCIEEAVRVFEGMGRRNSHVWSAMIGGFALHGFAREAVRCLRRMVVEDGLGVDGVVLLGALTACAHGGLVEEGLRLFAVAGVRYSVVMEHEHYSSVVDMLCRVGRLEEALGIIREMPMRPLASVWGSLLTGCRNYKNVPLAELAVQEMQKIMVEAGEDEGVYVQLSNIYLNANKHDDARRVRQMVGNKGIKKTPAYSAIQVDEGVSSFVAGDQDHPMRMEICRTLDCLMDHITHYLFTEEDLMAFGNFERDDMP